LVHKKHATIIFEQLHETLANFNNVWYATLGRNLMQMSVVLATNVVAALPCEMQKS